MVRHRVARGHEPARVDGFGNRAFQRHDAQLRRRRLHARRQHRGRGSVGCHGRAAATRRDVRLRAACARSVSRRKREAGDRTSARHGPRPRAAQSFRCRSARLGGRDRGSRAEARPRRVHAQRQRRRARERDRRARALRRRRHGPHRGRPDAASGKGQSRSDPYQCEPRNLPSAARAYGARSKALAG